MIARSTGLVSIPDELSSEEAAPILCAGIATFNALKKSGAEAGDTVAVLGIGGLGHMAVQYARRMGFRVAAIGRGADIAEDAHGLGAHSYIDTEVQDAAQALNAMGGAKAIIATVGLTTVVSPLVAGLAPGGRLVMLGTGKEPVAISAGILVGGERSVQGSITGTPLRERADPRTNRHSLHPDHGCREMDEASKVCGPPVVAGGEAAKVFEPAEAAFDAVALFIDTGVVGNDNLAAAI